MNNMTTESELTMPERPPMLCPFVPTPWNANSHLKQNPRAVLFPSQRRLNHSKSKSSNFSLYLSIFLLILLPSTHVTKSSLPRVTRNAVSVTVSVPTLTCPCSIIVVAACTVSAIRKRVIMTGRRRRQKAETVTDFSTSESLAVEEVEGRMPMSWSLERRRDSCLRRKAESGGRAARR